MAKALIESLQLDLPALAKTECQEKRPFRKRSAEWLFGTSRLGCPLIRQASRPTGDLLDKQRESR